ncbi:hypothetical protein HBI81_037060 [Parastagonospora nodorum]|nr:hypothetical protein HBI76_051060 [Parastagonospora nodorum]KAH5377565.1 hypothetical protein HBI33_157180 [Parastagonospora nodorum]KAH5548423.1 hypothetical protein HBI27_033540 [Parastagonospora nodorum]KAH5754806.1 hypothetical protein HBI17_081560 [Parastagonospora nodorum]KAH6022152.1 hypothetical protein HBI83_094970 [Parastagonospora nodorum]
MDYNPSADFSHEPTRTKEEARALHQIADTNFRQIMAGARAVATETPSLRSVYLKSAKVYCAPADLGIKVLFKRFNDMARAKFVAHPSLDDELNALIFYYGFDKQHSFVTALDQSRINIALAIYTMASYAAGTYGDATDVDKATFWYSYSMAWIESLSPYNNFHRRTEFLANWRRSSYDLVWFGSADKRRMYDALTKLSAGKPPIEGSPLTFLTKCTNGEISEQEFLRVGPAMAIHFMIANCKKSGDNDRWAKKFAEDYMRDVVADAEEVAHKQRLNAHLARQREEDALLEEGELEVPEKEEEDDDEMDIDDTIDSGPDGVDLHCVNWDDEGIQALLNIDWTLAENTAPRPGSDRRGWIDAKDAYRILISEGDDLAAALKKALCIA